jgi:type I restriction enzyme S subunit
VKATRLANDLQLRSLPDGWQWVKMNDACSRVQDGTHFSPKEQTRIGDFKYITAKNIKHWGLDLSNLTYVPERVHREIYKRCNVEKDDVLYIKDGVTTGIATVNTLEEEFSLLSSVALLKPRHDILDSLFLKYYLNSPEGFRNMTGQMTGTAIKRLILQKIKAAAIPLAPLPEQRRIVAEIEKQFTRLEAGVAALRRVQANLKRYRAAVLKAACEGRLVPTEAELAKTGRHKSLFESGESLLARILTDRRKNWQGRGKYKEPAILDTRLSPRLPEGWTWASVEQLAAPEPNSITDGPFGSNLKTEHYMAAGPRVIRLQNIGDGVYVDERAHISQAHFDRLQKHRVFANDVVIAGFGDNPPRSCIIPEALGPAIVKADCIRFKPHHSVASKYMNVALNSEPVRKKTKGMVHGVGRPRLNLGEIKSIVLPLPPLAEQTRIVAEVERRLSVVEELEAVVSANLQRATRLRQSILQKAFTGELV